MDRPPRNCRKDRLVSFRLLSYSYCQAGLIELSWCLFAYFMFFGYNTTCQVKSQDLYNLSSKFFNDSPSGAKFGCSIEDQKSVLHRLQTAFYITVVLGNFILFLIKFVHIHKFQIFFNLEIIYLHRSIFKCLGMQNPSSFSF